MKTLFEHASKHIDELELSIRSYNALSNADIKTVGQLVKRTESELLKSLNFGRRSVKELKEILAGMGLSLGMR